MANLSIFIDIDQEFDKVLETIAIAGMAGKLAKQKAQNIRFREYETLMQQTHEKYLNAWEYQNTKIDDIIILNRDYKKWFDNHTIRNSKGRFTSTHKELHPDNLKVFIDEQNYRVVKHIRDRLNPKAQASFDRDFNLFVSLQLKNVKLRDAWVRALNKGEEAYKDYEIMRNAV